MKIAIVTALALAVSSVSVPSVAQAEFPCLTPSCRKARDAKQKQQEFLEQLARETAEAQAQAEADRVAREERHAEKKRAEAAERAEKDRRDAESAAANRVYHEQLQAKKREAYEAMNAAAIGAGFAGYVPAEVFRLLRTTQQRGGLEDALGYVVGCIPEFARECRETHNQLKVAQVLPEFVLWEFRGMDEGELVTVTAITDREPGKLYQEGQVFDGALYSFAGMQSFTTVLGAPRTAARFNRFRPAGQ